MLSTTLLHAFGKRHLLVVVHQHLRALEGNAPLDMKSQHFFVTQRFDFGLFGHTFIRRDDAIVIRPNAVVQDISFGNLANGIRPGRARVDVAFGGRFNVGMDGLGSLLALR